MPANPTSLPLDLTAAALGNRVTAESHTVGSVEGRTFALDYGSFYTESLVIRVAATGAWLRPGNDFMALHLHKAASKASNKEVCQVIHVDDSISGELLVSAQMVGGEYSGSAATIQELIDAQDLDNRTAVWGEILHKPQQFSPANHLHHLQQLYGWEGAINLLEEIRIAILRGDVPVREAMYNYLNAQLSDKQSQIDALHSALQNYQLATTAERGMALLAALTTPLSNSEKVVTPEYLGNTIEKRYWERPIASALVWTDTGNLKDWILIGPRNAPGEEQPGPGHYEILDDDNVGLIEFAYCPGAEGLNAYQDDRPSRPEEGNWVILDKVDGAGSSDMEGLVGAAGWQDVNGVQTWVFTVIPIDQNSGKDYVDGSLYFPRELKEQALLANENIVVRREFRGLVNIIRSSQGHLIANVKREVLAPLDNGVRVFPAGTFEEASSTHPRVATGADFDLNAWFSGIANRVTAETHYMRGYVPFVVRDTNDAANTAPCSALHLQFWAH